MNGFLTSAIAHDATCEPGDEWVFDGMARYKVDSKGEDDPITEDEIEEAKVGCAAFCIILMVGIGFGIWYFVSH